MFAFTLALDAGERLTTWGDIGVVAIQVLACILMILILLLGAAILFEKEVEPRLKRYTKYRQRLALQKPVDVKAQYRDRHGTVVNIVGVVTRYDGALRVITYENALELREYSLEDFNHQHSKRLCHFPAWW